MKSFIIILCVILLTAQQVCGVDANCNNTDIDANKLCAEQGSVGTLALECDTTCNRFVICFILGGELQGLIKNCPNGYFYNRSVKYCSAEKPEYCS